jgi:hypothetical protein
MAFMSSNCFFNSALISMDSANFKSISADVGSGKEIIDIDISVAITLTWEVFAFIFG